MRNLLLGDGLALAVTTVLGFITHRETDLPFLPRFLAIFIPLIVAWFLIAPRLGLFQPEITTNPKQLWRVLLAMIIVAPLAVAGRSLILQTAVVPIFVLAFGGTSTLGMMIWRGLYFASNPA